MFQNDPESDKIFEKIAIANVSSFAIVVFIAQIFDLSEI